MGINYVVSPSGSDNMNGLIAKIKKENPGMIGTSIYTSGSEMNAGRHEYILTWSSLVQTASISSAFLQINFDNLFLSPTHYSNRGWTGNQYAKKWNVYGINSTKGQVLLSEDTAAETGYCGTGQDCVTSGSFLYRLKYPKNNLIGIKWVPTLGSLNGKYYFQSYGIELFGTLSSKKTKIGCDTCKHNSKITVDKNIILVSLLILANK